MTILYNVILYYYHDHDHLFIFTMIFHPLQHVNPEAPTAAEKCWKKAQLGEVDLLSH